MCVDVKERTYLPRLIDKKLDEYLKAFGAICIEGPKWSGKTMTSEQHCRSIFAVGAPAGNFNNRKLAETDPSMTLEGDIPRLIDEWQDVPAIWDAVRFSVDFRDAAGQFILTGSAVPPRSDYIHSGAGRIARIRMRPMSLFESGDSTGSVSLKSLFDGKRISCLTGDVSLKQLIEFIIRGGWPQSVGKDFSSAKLFPRQYIDAIISEDLNRVDDTRRDIRKMELLLRSLARNESTAASNRKLASDIAAAEEQTLDVETVSEYLNVFERLFLLDNQQPFSISMRSSIRVKQAVKRHFSDPSLACALLGASADALLNDLDTLGLLFEALVERDLAIYAEAHGGKLFHYQDYRNNEIDAVVEMPDGSWGAFEIKLGAGKIDEAATNLIRIQRVINKGSRGKAAAFLCVISGLTNAAYVRPDGVYVVPITALRD